MPMSAGEAAYTLAFAISPITLTNGIAANLPGGVLPLISLTESANFTGLLSGGNVDLSNTFANFVPLPSTNLVSNQIGNYPFANMAVAANAIIAQPLVVSLLMRCPVRNPGGYQLKLSIMTALQNTLKAHNIAGGTYTVATPSFFYTNCILLELTDVSGGDSNQAEYQYKWDFIKPLVTLQDAIVVQNAMMSALSSGGATQGALSGNANLVGAPQSAAAPGVAPPLGATAGAGVPSAASGE